LIDPVVNGAGASLSIAEPIPGLEIAFDVEPLGLIFTLLASLLWFVTSVYGIGYMRGGNEPRQTSFYAFFAIAISGAMGVATAGNLLTLFIFYEVLTLSTWPLVTHKQNEAARAGGRTYLGVLLATSIGLLLPAIIWTWVVAGTTDFVPGGILVDRIGPTAAAILLAMFVLGIGKAAVMPMHRWLPAAMVAPTPVSALLHAVAVVKAGVFTITKVVVYIFGLDFLATVPLEKYLVYLAGFTVVAASIVALKQVEIKRMLAYSTISQLGLLTAIIGIGSPLALATAGLHTLAHSLFKATLFMTVGIVDHATGTRDIRQLGGLRKQLPATALAGGLAAACADTRR
jgi:multicomponent Na+:H+ antiporter subunit D